MRRGALAGPRLVAVGVAGAMAVALAGCGLLGVRGSKRAGPVHAGTPRATSVHAGTPWAGSVHAETPRAGSAGGGAPPVVARADRTHEVPTPAPSPRVVGGWRTPETAVRSFTTVYVNWTASTVVARLRALAGASLGQARAELTVEADEVARDGELRTGGIGNAGSVEAVAPAASGRDAFAVVTRERTTAADDAAYRGLAPQWHVSVATVTRVRGGLWAVSGWQPEN